MTRYVRSELTYYVLSHTRVYDKTIKITTSDIINNNMYYDEDLAQPNGPLSSVLASFYVRRLNN